MLLTVKDDKRAEAYESNLCWMVQNPCVKKKELAPRKLQMSHLDFLKSVTSYSPPEPPVSLPWFDTRCDHYQTSAEEVVDWN